MPQPLRSLRLRGPAMSALAAALLLAGIGAGAQERSPYYIGLSQAFSHDSNVFRTASDEVSETISSTGVLAGIDQPLGRQRLYGDVSAQVNRYRRSDQLDNKSYAALAGLDWQTIEFLSGTLRYSTRNSLADFGTLEGASAPSDQTTQQALASVRYGLSSRLSLDGSYEYRSLEYKSAAYANRNYSQDTVGAGVHYGTPSILVFGLAGRVTRGSTPQFQATPPFEDELKRRDIDFTVMWTPTGFSTLNLRVSATKETHTLASNSEVSAGTGAVSWDYRPTAKLGFTTTLSRDTGTETTFSATAPSGSAPLRVDNNRLSTLGEIGVRYAMTSKVSMTLDARHRKGTTPTGGDDKQTGYGVGVSYNPTRSSTLACNVLQDRRDAPGSSEYTATTTSCSAQITLR